ncbi:MAG: hypothetical protein IKS23_04790 [Alphaproteobacteria bacterium]|nr:hypothetical protein [Alphaproteobacteria bacterium]
MLSKSSDQLLACFVTIVFAAFFAFMCITYFSMFSLWVWIVLGAFAIVAICLIDIPSKNWRFLSSIGGALLALIALIISHTTRDWQKQHPKQQEVVCQSIRKIQPQTSNIYYPNTLYFLECARARTECILQNTSIDSPR